MKEVYVFGAGASNTAANIPLGSELGWKYFNDCVGVYEVEGRTPVEHDLKEKLEYLSVFFEFCDVIAKYFPEHKGLKEKAHDTLKKALSDPTPYQLSKKYYIEEALKYIGEYRSSENYLLHMKSYEKNYLLFDYTKLYKNKDEYFFSDGDHLDSEGRKDFSQMFSREINAILQDIIAIDN
jgi:hypothetical protein